MPTIDNWRALREALDAGPTEGPCEWWTSCSFRRLSAAGKDGGVLYPDVHRADNHGDIVGSPANMKYIETADPTTIRSLLDERDRLAAEVEALRADAGRFALRIEEAFMAGFGSPETYNDTLINTADEAWKAWREELLSDAAMKGKP